HGWVAFDPTPPAGLNKYEGGLLATMRHYGEAVELFWMERVIGFDAQAQLSIALKAQRWLTTRLNDAASRWYVGKERFGELIRSCRVGRQPKFKDPSSGEA